MNIRASASLTDTLLTNLLAAGIDPRAVDRARLVALENGQRVESVMIQLGLATERQIADAVWRSSRRIAIRWRYRQAPPA